MNNNRFVFEWHNDWSWPLDYFTFLLFDYEYFLGGIEINCVILGLGFYFRYNTDEGLKYLAKWDKEIGPEYYKSFTEYKTEQDNGLTLEYIKSLWYKE